MGHRFRRLLFVALIAALAAPTRLSAQATHVTTSGTLPASCRVGDVYYKTGASAGLYNCTATNTWTLVAAGTVGNNFFAVTGPTTSTKTFTFPNANATVLTDNAAVTTAQGGTGLTAANDDDVLVGNGTVWETKDLGSCSGTNEALTYNTSTNAFGCQTISGVGGGGAPDNAQYWTGASDGTLSAEKNLGALSTGLVINTSGVPSAYGGSSCSAGQYVASVNASGVVTCSSPTLDVVGQLAITNVATEQTIYSYSLPGNSLGVLRLTMAGTYLNDSGAGRTLTIRIKYGSTTLYDDVSTTIGNTAGSRNWVWTIWLGNTTATNANFVASNFQWGAGTTTTGLGDFALPPGALVGYGSALTGTATEDSTGTLTFSATVQHSTNNSSLTITRQFGVLEALHQ